MTRPTMEISGTEEFFDGFFTAYKVISARPGDIIQLDGFKWKVDRVSHRAQSTTLWLYGDD